MLPNFVVVGAQKSATTFIHNCLKEHPEVFMPSEEIPYFEDPDYQENSLPEFESYFANVRNKKAIGIKRPTYLARPECAHRIKLHMPEAKIIAVLRNPVERAVSSYYHNIKVRFHSG